jgi:urease accessory protein
VRLLGLDPFAVQGLLARLAPVIDACAGDAARAAAAGSPAALPADAAPALDLLADFHLTAEVRLFAS